MKKEIRLPIGDDQEIVLTPFERGDKHFSIWLCQGSYDPNTQQWNTQFHIADFNLAFWIKQLQEIKENKEETLRAFYPKKEESFLKVLAEAIDLFIQVNGVAPDILQVSPKGFDFVVQAYLEDGDFPKSTWKDHMEAISQQVPLNLICYGMKIVRRFDEIPDKELFRLRKSGS
jgi:hypothetical protein